MTKKAEIPKFASSQKQATILYGVTLGEIKRAMNGGCRGFRSNKIYGDDLLAWLEANPVTRNSGRDGGIEHVEKEEADRLLQIEKAKKAAFENEIAMGRYVLVEDGKKQWSAGCEAIMGVIRDFVDVGVYNKIVKEVKRKLEDLRV